MIEGLETVSVELGGEVIDWDDIETGKWFVPIKDGEPQYEPFKIEQLSETWDSTSLGNHYNAYKAEGVTKSGMKTVYQIRGGTAKKFGDDGREDLKLVPYRGMNVYEEVSNPDELLDAEEMLSSDEEIILPVDEVRRTLKGETDSGKEIRTDEQPPEKKFDAFVAFHVSPLYQHRFR